MRLTLRLAALGSALSSTGASLMTVALPSLARIYGVPIERAQWLMLVYTLTVTACLLPFGRAADRYGYSRVARVGFFGFFAVSAALTVAPSFPVMLGLRAAHGASAALLMATLPAWLASVVPANERGRALGVQASATYLGLTAGPVLGGALVSALSARGVFVVLVPLAFVGFVSVPRPTHQGSNEPRKTPKVGGLFPRELLGNRAVVWGLVAAYLQYATTFAATCAMPFFLQDERGLLPRSAGLVLVAQPLVMALAAPIAGRISDLLGPKPLVVAGSLVCVVAALGLAGSLALSSLVPAVVGLGVLGLGAGLFTSPNNASLFAVAPAHLRGAASGLVALARNAGMATGVFLGARVLTLTARTAHPHGPAFVMGYRAALALAALLGVLSAVASGLRGPDGPLETNGGSGSSTGKSS